jgi:hypothetical protein
VSGRTAPGGIAAKNGELGAIFFDDRAGHMGVGRHHVLAEFEMLTRAGFVILEKSYVRAAYGEYLCELSS